MGIITQKLWRFYQTVLDFRKGSGWGGDPGACLVLQVVTSLIRFLVMDMQEICKIKSAKIHFYVLVFLIIFLQSNTEITSSVLNYIKIFYEEKHTKALIMKFTLLWKHYSKFFPHVNYKIACTYKVLFISYLQTLQFANTSNC